MLDNVEQCFETDIHTYIHTFKEEFDVCCTVHRYDN